MVQMSQYLFCLTHCHLSHLISDGFDGSGSVFPAVLMKTRDTFHNNIRTACSHQAPEHLVFDILSHDLKS